LILRNWASAVCSFPKLVDKVFGFCGSCCSVATPEDVKDLALPLAFVSFGLIRRAVLEHIGVLLRGATLSRCLHVHCEWRFR
jgi:hypothetical protein